MSIEKRVEEGADSEIKRLGYELFREGSVRRFNPRLFAVIREDYKGWFLVELKDGRWTCDAVQSNPMTRAIVHTYMRLCFPPRRNTLRPT